MTTAELLAQLEKDVIAVIGSPKVPNGANNSGTVKTYSVNILQETGLNKASKGTFNYFVINEGVVAGPVTYANDVLDEDGVTVLHSAGDPVMDDQDPPQQIVITEADAEQAFGQQALALPKEQNAKGMAFLAGKILDGTISSFELTNSRPDLGIFSFFDVEVMKNIYDENGDIVPWKGVKEMWRVQETANGDATFYVVEAEA